MIFGNRVTELREKLSLSKSELADRVGVTTATITNWENWKSTPTRNNLEMLALMLCTTTDYLEGITDDASPEISSAPPAESEKTPPAITQPGLCEDCGTPVPERVRKCPSCRWKTRWPESVLNSPKLASRRKRSHSVHLLLLDREKPEAIFDSSTDKNRTTYITTLETCTCRDFEITRGEIPCKHILRLAGELGFFQSEYFALGEDDYTLHTASKIPDDNSASAPAKKSECTFHKNGDVEIGFQIEFVSKPSEGRPHYLPSESVMAEWKTQLDGCKSIDEGIQLIADLKLKVFYIMEFAKYLGVSLSGCAYIKAEIVKCLVEKYFDTKNEIEILPEASESVKYLPAVVSEPDNLPRKPGIFLRLLKYAACCFFGFWAVVLVLLAVEGDKPARCFPVAFVIAGLLTAITAKRKREKSVFKWWLYGAVVPFVSWIDVVMLNSENRVKAFMKGVAYSLVVLIVFLMVLVNFLP